jgi:aarF domain-containing kinase
MEQAVEVDSFMPSEFALVNCKRRFYSQNIAHIFVRFSALSSPHPGNMLRTNDGKLAILDFGLMTEITDDQKYGMIEAIAHLINRDYEEIGQDFINLDFIPKGTDTRPIVPALTKVFDVALAGGGAKSINFQELAADLAEITFEYPFRIPPYL